MLRLTALLIVVSVTLGHQCIHDKRAHPKIEEHSFTDRLRLESHVENDKKLERERQQSNFKPMRIYFHTDGLDRTVKDQTKLIYIKNRILPAAKNYFEQSLFVMPADRPVVVKSASCEVPRGDEITKSGRETDLILVTSADYEDQEGWVAYAGACQIDPNLLGRANVGIVHFNIPHLQNENFESDLNVAIHEITHVLGFSNNRYKDFVDANGRKLTDVVGTVSNKVGQFTALKLPKVIEAAKAHYGCDNIQGIGLENAGGSGTAGSHWERLFIYNDIMTASVMASFRKTAFTFAFLEGTGWYKINPKMIEDVSYGKGKGCNFITSFCRAKFPEFCTGNDGLASCTPDNVGFASCESDPYTEPCNIVAAEPCAAKQRHEDGSADYAGAEYGPNSKCIDTDAITKGYQWSTPNRRHPACHTVECTGGKAYIVFNNGRKVEKVECTKDGETVRAPASYSGSLICPKLSDICRKNTPCPKDCNGQGVCEDGKCKCNFGLQGPDCGQATCPNGCSGRGYCDRSGKCYCNSGFTGAGCEKRSRGRVRINESDTQKEFQILDILFA